MDSPIIAESGGQREPAPPVCPDELVISIARFAGRTKPRGWAEVVPWPRLRDELLRHRVRTEKDGAGWSPCRYHQGPPYRSDKNVVAVGALVLDVEDGS